MAATRVTPHMATRRTGVGVAGIIAAFASTIRGKTITTTAIIRNSVTAPLDMRAVVAGAFTVAVVVAAGAIAEFF
jgi:hypothetical protein